MHKTLKTLDVYEGCRLVNEFRKFEALMVIFEYKKKYINNTATKNTYFYFLISRLL